MSNSVSAEPSVVAICLTADRAAMTRQAVESFRRQTYQNKRLLVFDTGKRALYDDLVAGGDAPEWYAQRGHDSRTIGELRNEAMGFPMANDADIIVHFDSDDLSHPNRIAEQVALLQSSGADACGFNELLFWREPVPSSELAPHQETPEAAFGEAWLYSNVDQRYPPGSSLAYWRKTWEAKPFAATSFGEDEKFCRGMKVVSVTSCPPYPGASGLDGDSVAMRQPRMICRIHSSNTSTTYKPSAMEAEARKQNGMWRKAPEWNSYCAAEFAR